MNNILGDRFKKPCRTADRELEGRRRQRGAWREPCGRRNTEREVLGEMMSADMVQAVYETLHDRPDELFAFAHKQSEGQMNCKTLLKTLRRLPPRKKVYLDAMALLGAVAQNKAEWDEKGPLTFGTHFQNGRLPRRRGGFPPAQTRAKKKIEEVRSAACHAVRYGVHKINARLGRVHRSKKRTGAGVSVCVPMHFSIQIMSYQRPNL